jgi:hypothetical protein
MEYWLASGSGQSTRDEAGTLSLVKRELHETVQPKLLQKGWHV